MSREYYHANRLGSVIAMADETGTLTAQYVYTPFGVEDAYNASGNPFRYTGRRLDAQWGIYYYRARYYDPQIGRFLETDPAWYVDSMNLYAYVGNNPVNAIDPNGEEAVGLKIEGQAVAGKGGKFSVEVSVDFKTGEIRASGSVGFRAGLRGKGSISGFVEPSSKQGNSLSGKGVVSAEGGADIKTPFGTGEISSSAEFGAGTDGLVTPDPDALLDVSGSVGPVSVDENGRASVGIGGGLGASAGTEYTVEGSFSIPDTIDAAKGVVDNIREQFE